MLETSSVLSFARHGKAEEETEFTLSVTVLIGRRNLDVHLKRSSVKACRKTRLDNGAEIWYNMK